jgi:hypothetical protein
MIQPNSRYAFFQKILCMAILAVVFSLSPFHAPKAHALWGEIINAVLTEELAEIYDEVQGVILGAQKQAAIQSLNNQVSDIVGGSSTDDSKVIGDYSDFIYDKPTEKTKLYVNDLIDQSLDERGSYSGYEPNNEGFGSSEGGNYYAQLKQITQDDIINPTDPKVTYSGDPGQNMFSDGNLGKFLSYTSPYNINNSWNYESHFEYEYEKKLTKEQDAARTEAQAGGGYASTRQGDTIVTPGSLIGANMANVQDIGNNVIANAQHMPEIITSLVQQMITQTIQNGIGNAKQNAQRENNQNQSSQNSSGSSYYDDSSNQSGSASFSPI